MRINKYIAQSGLCSRRKADELIANGNVRVNAAVLREPGYDVQEGDRVEVNGHLIETEAESVYVLINKPLGMVTTVSDDKERLTVMEVVKDIDARLFPVGRLDLDTEGLLLITNDGTLAHELLSPKKHVTKTYFAKVQGRVTTEDVKRFSLGLDIGEEKPTLPATLVIEKSDDISEIRVSITEGKYHQVKRMFEAVGKQVLFLKRLSMGTLQLDETLTPGSYRALTTEELSALKNRTI